MTPIRQAYCQNRFIAQFAIYSVVCIFVLLEEQTQAVLGGLPVYLT